LQNVDQARIDEKSQDGGSRDVYFNAGGFLLTVGGGFVEPPIFGVKPIPCICPRASSLSVSILAGATFSAALNLISGLQLPECMRLSLCTTIGLQQPVFSSIAVRLTISGFLYWHFSSSSLPCDFFG